jgi:hypothetical protein
VSSRQLRSFRSALLNAPWRWKAAGGHSSVVVEVRALGGRRVFVAAMRWQCRGRAAGPPGRSRNFVHPQPKRFILHFIRFLGTQQMVRLQSAIFEGFQRATAGVRSRMPTVPKSHFPFVSTSPRLGRGSSRRGRPRRQEQLRKVYTPFADNELAQIDRWGFAQHIRDRSAAIRALVVKAIASDNTAGRR